MPQARTTDPQTSHDAAKSVSEVSKTKEAILDLLLQHQSDMQLVANYIKLVTQNKAPRASESGIRSRRAELVKLGFVKDTGKRDLSASNRQMIVWGRN
jgi:DNA integrity scanning protein DisA with diadenylate cyclase activity